MRAWKDGKLSAEAREVAASVLAADPTLAQHVPLRHPLARRLDAEAEAYLSKN